MAVFDATRPTSPLTEVVGRMIAWYDRRMTVKALSKLTDRELDDIGLMRGDLEQIARRG
ncbi:MAG: DUF1127 domain-containing protein [Pseudomonadota bacterium]